ncbi:MAG: RNA polymerase sigma factor [Phycisphaerales bacterium]|nr:MAG: RNA polymerase sigma factor [Phycisphaerales bacterium]
MESCEPSSGHQVDEMTPSLVLRLRAGDPEVGALLDQLYRDALVRFCWGYLGHIEEAEDAAQDICCRVLSTENIPDAFRPWLYKTARNHCLNLRRGRARRKDGAELPSASQVHEILTGHLTRLVRSEERSRLSELVGRLPDSQREVLRLRYVEDLSRAEIAEVLDIPESVVKSRLFEGLKRLREEASSTGK